MPRGDNNQVSRFKPGVSPNPGGRPKLDHESKESDLNNRQVYDFVDKQVDFVELKLQDLVLWRQEPCNFEP